MKFRRSAAIPVLVALAFAFAGCDVAPHGKTVVLPTPVPSPTVASAAPGTVSFELEKAYVVPIGDFDQAGFFPDSSVQLVYGWLDNDHLAAIGVTQVPQATSADTALRSQALRAKGYYSILGAGGCVGQILSVDWQTGKSTELHTVQDAVITSMGLSHDKSKLWYCSFDKSGENKLSVSDVAFKHDMLEIPSYQGFQPSWSSEDKYFAYVSSPKTRTSLELFDGVNTQATSYIGGLDSPFLIDDGTGTVFSFVKGALIATMALPDNGQPAPAKPAVDSGDTRIVGKFALSPVNRLTWDGPDFLLFIGDGTEGSNLNVANIQSGGQPDTYSGVLNFALSDDRKYICLVKEASGGTADIYIGRWSDGSISDEKLVFKGFTATGNIYFSPDDAKLYIEGHYGYADAASTTAMVLEFK